MNNNLKNLENIIDYSFKNKSLLKHSLMHKSFDSINNNEKLEFLGDRVLGLIISKKLIEIFPNEKEGIIDKKFANLVNKKTCLLISEEIDLKKFMFLGNSHKGDLRSSNKIMGDCLEAIIGAIYLDQGFKGAEKFVLKFWNKYLENSNITLIDSKTKLQEYSLKKFKELPKYISQKKSGPHHQPVFKTLVQIPGSKKVSGTGTSIKKAQQNAATKLIKLLNIL